MRSVLACLAATALVALPFAASGNAPFAGSGNAPFALSAARPVVSPTVSTVVPLPSPSAVVGSAVAGSAVAGSAVAGSAAVQYAWPVPAPVRVVAAFVVPAGPYAPGHRGVDLATGVGGAVLAAADGWVRFAGPVAGRGVVVLAHADGLVTEYEPLRPTVQAGERVRRGQVIGVVAGRHRTCPPGRCVHWAARRADTYVDPARLLAPLAPPRLLPWPRR